MLHFSKASFDIALDSFRLESDPIYNDIDALFLDSTRQSALDPDGYRHE